MSAVIVFATVEITPELWADFTTSGSDFLVQNDVPALLLTNKLNRSTLDSTTTILLSATKTDFTSANNEMLEDSFSSIIANDDDSTAYVIPNIFGILDEASVQDRKVVIKYQNWEWVDDEDSDVSDDSGIGEDWESEFVWKTYRVPFEEARDFIAVLCTRPDLAPGRYLEKEENVG